MKKFSLIVLTLLFAISPLASAYYTPDGADITPTGLEFEGATKDAFSTSVDIVDPTADRTITVPDSDETVGTASAIEDNLILSADLADEDWGDVSVSSNSVTLDANVVDTVELVTDATDATILQDVVADNSANQACNTTCGIAGCYFGFDAGTNALVDCASALADTCACDGATS